jgi:hypothetical protein
MCNRIGRFASQKGFAPLEIIVVTGALLLVTIAGILSSNDNLIRRILGVQPSNTTLNTPPIQVTLPSTPTSTIAPAYQPTFKTATDPLIDCIGPDGKHLQLTQKACDDFNAAWRNKPVVTQNPTQQYNSGNQAGQNITQGQVNQLCDQIVGDTAAICITNCGMTAKLDNNNCTGDSVAVEQCYDASTAKMTACDDNCRNTANEGYVKCAR